MAKRVPKHIKRKLERMSVLMDQLVRLDFEVEAWLEANGIHDGWEFTDGRRDDRGYGICDVDGFVRDIEAEINGRDE